MPNVRWLLALITSLHRFLYRASGGWLGARGLHYRFLLLGCVGRRSGRERVVPLLYVPDGARFVVVGSNSIFIYLFHEILNRWLTQTGLVFTSSAVAMWEPGGRMLNAWLVIAFKIWLCFWLYRRKIFFKL